MSVLSTAGSSPSRSSIIVKHFGASPLVFSLKEDGQTINWWLIEPRFVVTQRQVFCRKPPLYLPSRWSEEEQIVRPWFEEDYCPKSFRRGDLDGTVRQHNGLRAPEKLLIHSSTTSTGGEWRSRFWPPKFNINRRTGPTKKCSCCWFLCVSRGRRKTWTLPSVPEQSQISPFWHSSTL